MTIERLGPVDPVQKFSRTERVSKPETTRESDSISVSDEARVRAEMMQAMEQVRSMPDIRQDRVEEVRRKLEDPSYINDRVVDLVADRIIEQFDIG